MKNNPYFKFLKKDVKNMMMVLTVIIFINVGMNAISTTFMALEPGFNRQVNLYSQGSQMGVLVSFVFGIVITLKHFSGAISIRGNRKDYLKAFASWSVIITLFTALFPTAFEVGLKFLMEITIHKEVVLISDFYYIDINGLDMVPALITPIWFMKTIVYRFISNLAILSLGYMLGAIGYRLSKRANIGFFVVLPTLIISYLVSAGMRESKFVENLMFGILDMVIYLCQHINIAAMIQIVCIGIFSFIGTKFLIKAPTKEYANDLL